MTALSIFTIFLMLAALCSAMTVNLTTPIVDTSSGSIHGVRTSINGRSMLKFLGVPYAQPPVGNLRFKAPFPITTTPASSVDATSFRPSCMQPPHLRRVIYRPLHEDLDESLVSEDCLYLNIYVPEKIETSSNIFDNEKLAVMVWLPGEGFDFGYANQYDGSRLAAHGNVIVVTVNYRLSAFGFLSTGDEEAPGNIGLRDQLLAIKWLRDNVESFGGDPERLTVFGRLTGSISVSALMASPHAQQSGKSLFRRAILQSGVAEGDWIFEKNPLEQARMLAERVNCSSVATTSSSSLDLIQCLRQVPATTLLRAAVTSLRPWRLILDNDFLPKSPLKSSNLTPEVDLMIGANEHEGSLCLLTHLAQQTEYMDKMLDNNFTSLDLHDLMKSHVEDYYHSDINNELHNTAQIQYPCNLANNNNNNQQQQEVNSATSINCRQQFLTFCGDLYIHAAVSAMANKLATDGSNVYRYEFTHRPSFSHYPQFVGAAQGDEVLFIFGLVDNPTLNNVSKDEIKLSHQMMTAWSNFAKNGNPNQIQRNVHWPRYVRDGQLLDISLNMGPESVRTDAHSHRLAFWTQLSGNSS